MLVTQDVLELSNDGVQRVGDLRLLTLVDRVGEGDEAEGEEDGEERDDAREVHCCLLALLRRRADATELRTVDFRWGNGGP